MRTALLLLFACLGLLLRGQVVITGRVVDARTGEALAFVPVNRAGANTGVVSDIDGRFRLEVPNLPATLRMGHVGYETLELTVSDPAPLVARLQQRDTELRPVVVNAADNPAHRIIRRAHANRRANDGLRQQRHRYTSYSKTVFDLELDSAIANDPQRLAALDTGMRKAYDFAEAQHLLLIESATRRHFIPPASSREEVLAMRVSGMRDPSLLAMVAQTESFSIYEPDIRISDKSYLGPLGPASTAKYRFVLEDTLYQGADSIYVISYRPRPNTRFNGLKGLLYINTDGYAVQNVTAEPAERKGVSVRFQQLHERIDGHWFPRQLNSFIYFFDNTAVSVNGLGVVGVGRTYLKDVAVGVQVERRDVRGPELVADRMELRRDDAYWQQWRVDSLDRRDLKTYAVIDSLGDSLHLDRKVKWLEALTTGRLPMGPLDLHLARLLHYNGYEGLRLGAGLSTNERVSRVASVGGYFGYGLRDRAWKHGGDLTIKPVHGREMWLRMAYENDVTETGGVGFPGQSRMLVGSEGVRYLYMDRMDRTERISAQVMARLGSSLKVWLGTERAQRINAIGYQFAEELADGVTRLRNDFLTGAVTADVRWAFREKVARLPHREISLGTRHPVVHLQVMRAVKGLWAGEWDTWRMNAMVEKTFRIRLVGDLGVRVLGGLADPRAPMPFLFNLRGTNAPGEFLVNADNTFETMRPNEFLADRYATLHLRHSFGNLLFRKGRFRPVPVLLTSVAIGGLSSPGLHRGLAFNALDGPFVESGLRIDRLYNVLGVGVFYRYGPQALPEVGDNVVAKLSMAFNF